MDAASVAPRLGELSAKLEERVLKSHQQKAFDSVREEHGKYFEALEKHPRLLVGSKVPAIGKEGEETLRSSEDAKEWQEAVKSILVQEINARAQTSMDESKGFIETVHASIDLFKNNKDLIPGTKGFNRELAEAFAGLATPYEIRVDGKLSGYSIPVQPMIDSLRKQLKAQPAPPKAPAAAPRSPVPEPPQAGITSKAGTSGEKEDFSTLFGTIGLPHLKI